MSNPEERARLEELAALKALSMLNEEEQSKLLAAIEHDPEAARFMHDFGETAALLAHDAPQVEPPPGLRAEILRRLPRHQTTSKIVPFAPWIPYAIAAGLMAVGVAQAWQIFHLRAELASVRGSENDLRDGNAEMKLRLAVLEAKDHSYASSTVIVAWDPLQHRGTIAMQNLPPAPAGHNYQLWLLDPGTKNPISAGLISVSGPFGAEPVSNTSPAFAISVEPRGGSPSPTGPIIFASSAAL